jgi:threonine dehydrogenase-like Zn-dependent dehydrogenase
VLDGTIQPGRVFEPAIRLDDVPAAYRAMASREAIKVLINP